jgi:hypothetical protein
MAITASVALSPSTQKAQQTFTVTLTVNNSAAAAVNVLSIVPLLYPVSSQATDGQSASAQGVPALGPGFSTSVPGSGSATFSWTDVVHVPQGGYWAQGGTTQTWTVGALVATNDGALTVATTAALTVTNNP